jgi:hypothetical protein
VHSSRHEDVQGDGGTAVRIITLALKGGGVVRLQLHPLNLWKVSCSDGSSKHGGGNRNSANAGN